MLTRLTRATLELLWPSRCAACGDPADALPLCYPCLETLVPGGRDCCPRCGHVYLDPALLPGGHLPWCGACLVAEPPYARARAAFAYGAALQDAIVRWKNAPDHTLGPHLARLMLAEAHRTGWATLSAGTVVVPVPAHPRRVRQRGFNPAGLLASGLARGLGLPLGPTALEARKQPPNTQGASRAQRLRRVRGVFRARPGALTGREVLLVDDVMTTGATVWAAAEAALRGGAARVEVAVLARVPRD